MRRTVAYYAVIYFCNLNIHLVHRAFSVRIPKKQMMLYHLGTVVIHLRCAFREITEQGRYDDCKVLFYILVCQDLPLYAVGTLA